MTMNQASNNGDILNATSRIVSAYISKNDVNRAEITELVTEIYEHLTTVSASCNNNKNIASVIDVEDSIQSDYIVCLEDGKKLKMLKRYLKTNYDMTPEEYRKRWNLPNDYPMVAPEYAKRRSELAKNIGLGKNKRASIESIRINNKVASGTIN